MRGSYRQNGWLCLWEAGQRLQQDDSEKSAKLLLYSFLGLGYGCLGQSGSIIQEVPFVQEDKDKGPDSKFYWSLCRSLSCLSMYYPLREENTCPWLSCAPSPHLLEGWQYLFILLCVKPQRYDAVIFFCFLYICTRYVCICNMHSWLLMCMQSCLGTCIKDRGQHLMVFVTFHFVWDRICLWFAAMYRLASPHTSSDSLVSVSSLP